MKNPLAYYNRVLSKVIIVGSIVKNMHVVIITFIGNNILKKSKT